MLGGTSLDINTSSTFILADSAEETTSYVSVDEIYNVNTLSWNYDKVSTLLCYLAGKNGATMSDIYTLAQNITDASEIRSTSYLDKSNGQDVVVRLGGLDWYAVYLSQDTSGNSILTLWLNSAKQEAWSEQPNKDYYFLNGTMYAPFSSVSKTSNNSANYFSNLENMYGGSSIRYCITSNSLFDVFNKDEYGLNQYIVQPKNVSWQISGQNATSVVGYPLANENLDDSTTTGWYTDSTYGSISDMIDNASYSKWGGDYLWLPSVTEVGYSNTDWGMWNIATNMRSSSYLPHSFAYDETIYGDDDREWHENRYSVAWLRSGYYESGRLACCDSTYSSNWDRAGHVSCYAHVRPALHLNLSALVQSISDVDINIDADSSEYDGRVKLVSVSKDGSTLIENEDYTIAYARDGVTVSEIKDAGTYTITATGVGYFKDSVSTTYTVTARELSTITVGEISDYMYTGDSITPLPTLTYNGTTLKENIDYTIAYSSNINVGTATITLAGKGNYGGTVSKTFKILARDISGANLTLTQSTFDYIGASINIQESVMLGSTMLVANQDYTLVFRKNTASGDIVTDIIDVGTYYAVVAGKGNYTGTLSAKIEVNTRDITNATIQYSPTANVYTGSAICPEVSSIVIDGINVPNDCVDIAYFNNTGASTGAIISITGKGNFAGTATTNFTITQGTFASPLQFSVNSNVSVNGKLSIVYTGSAVNPLVVVLDSYGKQISSSDYKIEFKRNGVVTTDMTSVGLISIEVSPILNSQTNTINIAGSVIGELTIEQMKIEDAYIEVIGEYEYNNVDIYPQFVVYRDSSKTQIWDSSLYTSTITNNKYVGKGNISISFLGDYSGNISGQFTIVPRNVSNWKIAFDVPTLIYDGTAKTISWTVSDDNGTSLDSGNKDAWQYTYSYSNNINAGTATLTIVGRDNYTGTITKEFNINQKNINDEDIVVSGIESHTYSGLEIVQNGVVITNITAKAILNTGVDFEISYEDNIDVAWAEGKEIANAKMLITAKSLGNYTGVRVEKFIILAKSLSDADIAVASIDAVTYSGREHQPKPEVKFGDTVLSEEIIVYSWENNIDFGRASVIITARPNTNFAGSITCYFDINISNLTGLEISNIEEDLVYNGQEQKQIPTLKSGDYTLILNTDYTISYSDDTTNVGVVIITISGINNYSGETTCSYNIIPLELSKENVTIQDIEDIEFTGSNITPYPIIVFESQTLELTSDYTLSYRDNVNVGTAYIDIAGNGNFSGSITASFEIIPKELNLSDIILDIKDTCIYTGQQIMPRFEIKLKDNTILSVEKDYTFSYGANIDIGDGKIYLEFIGNYSGRCVANFDIASADISSELIEANIVPSVIYNGKTIVSKYSLKYADKELSGDDYSVQYLRNGVETDDLVNIGEITIRLTGKNNFAGVKYLNYIILPKPLSDDDIKIDIIDGNLKYTGSEISPSIAVSMGTKLLVEDVDFTISYSNNINASSEAEVIITAVEDSNFVGTKTSLFTIEKIILNVNYVSDIPDKIYSSNEIEPIVNIVYNGIALTQGIDFECEYSNNIDVGSGNITIKGIGNFDGIVTKSFNIIPFAISNVTIVGLKSEYTFTTTPICPTIELKYANKVLIATKDYTISYSDDSVNIGEKEIVVSGIGNFNGTHSLHYSIIAKSLSDKDIAILGVEDKNYAKGNEIIQDFVVKYDEYTVLGDDYTYSYENNINSGVATLTIVGTGNYVGSKSINFNILKLDTTATVGCLDERIYEGNVINLAVLESSVSGNLSISSRYYMVGEKTYNWTFIPEDTRNYNYCTGTITLIATALKVTGLVFTGDFKKYYLAYDILDTSKLVVNLEYNSGKTLPISNSQYILSKENGSVLHRNDKVLVSYVENDNINAYLPINISPRRIEIETDTSGIIANGEKQYLNITFKNENEQHKVEYEVVYKNMTNNTSNSYILDRGLYRAIISIMDDNYVLDNNYIDFEVYHKTVTSGDGSMEAGSEDGFGLSESLEYQIILDEGILADIDLTGVEKNSKFIAMYKFILTSDRDITISFVPNISDLSKLLVYKCGNNKLEKLSFVELADNYILISCKSSDSLLLFETVAESTNSGFEMKYILIGLFGLIAFGLVVYFIDASIMKSRNAKAGNNARISSVNDSDISSFEMQNESNLNDNNQPDNPNSANESSTTHFITEKQNVSKEEIKQYIVFDKNGKIAGIKDDSPIWVRNAYVKFKNKQKSDNQE